MQTTIRPINKQEIKQALDFSTQQIINQLEQFTDQFKKAYSENNHYQPTTNEYWTTGFWTGQIWLAYEYTGNEQLKYAGARQMSSFLERINQKIDVEHHDMGFLYSPSCVAGYQLTGNEVGREAALKAADQLLSRYQPVGAFLQAWGTMEDEKNYRLIIDCLLNVPLLYWAFQETKDQTYRKAAEQHIQTTLNNVIRSDFSTWHTFYFNPQTGAPDHGATCQGYRDGSAWARGQAWGIYGTAIAYQYTKNSQYIDVFRGVCQYFLAHLPADLVPYWDLEFGDGATEPKDSSAAVIAVCGMLAMVKYLDPKEAQQYHEAAGQILKSIYDHYQVREQQQSNGLLLHGTYSNHSPYNTCEHLGVDECNLWGDYFYLEALTRMAGDWNAYW